MSILDWFNKRQIKNNNNPQQDRLDIPGDLWIKCNKCSESLYLKDLEQNCKVCTCDCNYHFRVSPEERIEMHFDKFSFEEIESEIEAVDFLKFEDTELYKNRIKKAQKKTKHADAILIGHAKINHLPVNVGIMDFALGGSMGSSWRKNHTFN